MDLSLSQLKLIFQMYRTGQFVVLQPIINRLLMKLITRTLIALALTFAIYSILLVYFPIISLSYSQVIMGLVLLRCVRWYLR